MKNTMKKLLTANLATKPLTSSDARTIFLQALPNLDEPLKSAVEFTLANWEKLNCVPSESEIALNFIAELPELPTDARFADKVLIEKLNAAVRVLRDNPDIWQNLADLPHEEWRDVIGHEGRYQVSNFGRVKSFCYKKPYILESMVATGGYIRIQLNKHSKRKNHLLHRLVAQSFIPNLENKP